MQDFACVICLLLFEMKFSLLVAELKGLWGNLYDCQNKFSLELYRHWVNLVTRYILNVLHMRCAYSYLLSCHLSLAFGVPIHLVRLFLLCTFPSASSKELLLSLRLIFVSSSIRKFVVISFIVMY